jgi:hypothetical protein
MPSNMKQIEEKLDDQSDQIQEIHRELRVMNETLIINTEQLKIHIEGVKLAREQNEDYRREMEFRLKPLEETSILARGYIKGFMFLIGTPAAIYYLTKIYEFIKS